MAESQYGSRSDLSDKATDLKDKATEQFKKVADRAEGLASDAVDQLRDTGAGGEDRQRRVGQRCHCPGPSPDARGLAGRAHDDAGRRRRRTERGALARAELAVSPVSRDGWRAVLAD